MRDMFKAVIGLINKININFILIASTISFGLWHFNHSITFCIFVFLLILTILQTISEFYRRYMKKYGYIRQKNKYQRAEREKEFQEVCKDFLSSKNGHKIVELLLNNKNHSIEVLLSDYKMNETISPYLKYDPDDDYGNPFKVAINDNYVFFVQKHIFKGSKEYVSNKVKFTDDAYKSFKQYIRKNGYPKLIEQYFEKE